MSAGAAPGALLCDLDGTLADTLGGLHATANALRASHGLGPATAGQVRAWVGDGAARFTARALTGRHDGTLAPAAQADALAAFHALYARHLLDHLRAFPGVVATLLALRAAGVRLACITNKPAAHARAVLDALVPAGTIECLVTPDDGHGIKPDAGPLLAACAALGVAPERALMVGDSGVDVAAARAAGCAVITVRHGYGNSAAAGADAQVNAFAEVAYVWRRQRARIGRATYLEGRHGV